MSFPHIPKIRPLVSAIGIQNMTEEAHYEGSGEGQCPAGPLASTRWAGAAERDEKMRMVPTSAGECLAWREFAPWLVGHEVLRDVEAH